MCTFRHPHRGGAAQLVTRQRRAGQGLRHSCSLRCATVRGRVTRVLWHCTRGRVWHLTTARDRALVLPSTSSHSTTARWQHSAIGTAALHCPQSPDGSGIREHCCQCDVRIGWVFSSTTSSAASLSPRSMPSVQVQTVVLFKSIIRRTSSSGAVAPAVSQPINAAGVSRTHRIDVATSSVALSSD